MGLFRSADVRQLLHNKFVVVLGDSIQRSIYKDLVKLLQDDRYLSEGQLKRKGELTFENDTLVEGGVLNEMHNRTTFTEVRQYRSSHHLVRFYFLTRVYSTYMESILSDFQSGPQPDVLIVNSCVWDLMRYSDHHLEAYKNNLDSLFLRLKEVLSPECLIIWSMAMPVGYKGNEVPENTVHNLRMNVIEGNFFSASLARFHKLDVLDMHHHFRCNLRLRCRDAVHWNQFAHRKYTQILLSHIAQAWGVEPPKGKMPEGASYLMHTVSTKTDPYPKLRLPIKEPRRCGLGWRYMSGYTPFDGSSISTMAASSPFVTDNPFLNTNIPPGYHNPPPGPAFSGRSFVLPSLPPQITFTSFSHHVPYSHEDWNMKMMMRRKERGGWMHPYQRPPMYPSGIY
ncbi:PC-esterase domain-containing protein 1A-like [Leptodactylus fuscus]|uniref:PC-esterase domain-containing protein 1A-like n=1 Tax=Leptodactylus fuscus TaxID=238119 RepID=UPI003F4F114E